MSEYLKINSVAENIFDIKTADLSKFQLPFTLDKAKLETDIERMRIMYGKVITPEKIEAGDMAVISCKSDIARFNKPAITVNIGKNLYSAELEAAIIGMAVGETATITVNGAAVEVTVKSVTRRIPAELTDSAVAGWGIDGVSSVKDLRNYCIGKQVEDFINDDDTADDAAAYLSMMAVENTTFTMDNDELASADIAATEKYDEIQDGEDKPDNGDFMRDLTYKMQHASLKLAAIGYKLCLENDCLAPKEKYQEYIDSSSNPDAKSGKGRYSEYRYKVDYYADYYCILIDKFLLEHYKQQFAE